MKSRVFVCALTALVMAGTLAPLAAEASEIAWIAEMPGVSRRVETTGRGADGVYTVSGDSAAVFEKLKSGFTKRGWTIDKATNTGLSALTVRTLVAHKGGAEVKAVLNQTLGTAQLVVSTSGEIGEVEAPKTPARPAARGGVSRLDVPEGARGTLQCNDAEVVVNGNDGDFTLEGRCQQVTVHGNDNRIQIKAAVEAIAINGNRNSVFWSTAHNPAAPRTSDLGRANRIRKVE